MRVYRREEEQEQEQEQEVSLTLEWGCTCTVRSVAVLDSADMTRCRREDLAALDRGPKSWSCTIKDRRTNHSIRSPRSPKPCCCQIYSDSERINFRGDFP